MLSGTQEVLSTLEGETEGREVQIPPGLRERLTWHVSLNSCRRHSFADFVLFSFEIISHYVAQAGLSLRV